MSTASYVVLSRMIFFSYIDKEKLCKDFHFEEFDS
jgi:hypothetical protein